MPAFDRSIADPPLVRPREHARARPTLERGLELPVERLGLARLAAGAGDRQPHLTEHQRPVTGEVLELRQVTPEIGAPLQEDIEGLGIGIVERPVLRRRIVHVHHQLPVVDVVDRVCARPAIIHAIFVVPVQRTTSAGTSLPKQSPRT